MVEAMVVVGSPNSSNTQRLQGSRRARRLSARGAGAARRGDRLVGVRLGREPRRHRRRVGARGSGRGGHRRLCRALHGERRDRHHGRRETCSFRCRACCETEAAEIGSSGGAKSIRSRAWTSASSHHRASDCLSPSVLTCGDGRLYRCRGGGPCGLSRRLRPRRTARLQGHCRGGRELELPVHTSRGYFILTLYEKRVAAKDLPFFLGLMEHLHARGITCPQPVKNKQRRGARPGRRPSGGGDHLSRRHVDPRGRPPAIARALGEALAKLHLAGLDFEHRRANALSVEGWRPLYEHCRARANEVQRGSRASFSRAELAHLEARLAARPAAGRHPRRPVSRQRVLSRQQAVRA